MRKNTYWDFLTITPIGSSQSLHAHTFLVKCEGYLRCWTDYTSNIIVSSRLRHRNVLTFSSVIKPVQPFYFSHRLRAIFSFHLLTQCYMVTIKALVKTFNDQLYPQYLFIFKANYNMNPRSMKCSCLFQECHLGNEYWCIHTHMVSVA